MQALAAFHVVRWLQTNPTRPSEIVCSESNEQTVDSSSVFVGVLSAGGICWCSLRESAEGCKAGVFRSRLLLSVSHRVASVTHGGKCLCTVYRQSPTQLLCDQQTLDA